MSNHQSKCVCGKIQANLNAVNWERHLLLCKAVKIKNTSFFGALRLDIDTDTANLNGKIILFVIKYRV